jgi:tRNA A-37 threonylcarbamoyl transferase component Bud32
MALKLVLPGRQGEQPLELDKERDLLVRTAQVVPDVVAHVEGFNNFGENGAALLLRDVGGEVPQKAWPKVFEALGLLHENNIVHGDSRLDNAICVQGSVRWIDFRASAVFLNPADIKLKRRDMTILARSCYRETSPSVLEQVVQQYNGTKVSARGIFDALTVQHQQAALN